MAIVELLDALDLGGETLFVEAIGLKGTLAVVGDAEVLQAKILSGFSHVFERSATVTVGRVTMEGSSQVRPFDQFGEPAIFRGFKLTAVFAKFRFDVGEAERAVNISLRMNVGQRFLELAAALSLAEAIFIERPAAIQGARAHANVVLLAAREIVQRKGKFDTAYGPQIALDPRGEQHAGLGVAAGNNRLDLRMIDKISEHLRGIARGDNEVQVAHNLLFPPVTPRNLRENNQRVTAQIVKKFLRECHDIAEPELAEAFLLLLNRFENVFRGLRAKAGKRCDSALFACALELGDGAYPERLIERLDLLCAKSLQFEKNKDLRRELVAELLIVFEPASSNEQS